MEIQIYLSVSVTGVKSPNPTVEMVDAAKYVARMAWSTSDFPKR